ncbi:MAG: hydrogenase, partial [Burkholderiaceae bacterium]|nr:hydrogenase [Burkholderiaceae bacterium]
AALVQRLVSEFGAAWVPDEPQHLFIMKPGDCVLFIAGDPVRFPECLDVAVVLPELQRYFSSSFRIAVAERESEDSLAKRYGATRRPALVFLRDGQYVTTVAGMLDWDDYLREVAQALRMPPSRVPGIGIPLVSASAADACH